MGRPSAYSTDDFIDAAACLFSQGGSRAVKMAAVAKRVGAPSGSVYHRYADRPALLCALWQRTTARFEHDYRSVLGEEPDGARAVGAAVSVVDWCRAHPEDAFVLQAGARAFSPEEWPAEAAEATRATSAERDRELRAAVVSVARASGRRRDEARFAMVDLPLGVVRPHLARHEVPPPSARDLVRRLARLILLPASAD